MPQPISTNDDDRFAPLVGFRGRKAAQVAAYFASQEPGIEKLKLIKLIYLSEREFVGRHGHPMIYDELYSLKDGPICSSSLNAINGKVDQEYWSKLVTLENERNVKPVQKIERPILDQISDAELDILNDIWKSFGRMTSSQIRKWTHDNCAEYTEVTTGRIPITYAKMCAALKIDAADEIEEDIQQVRRLSSILST